MTGFVKEGMAWAWRSFLDLTPKGKAVTVFVLVALGVFGILLDSRQGSTDPGASNEQGPGRGSGPTVPTDHQARGDRYGLPAGAKASGEPTPRTAEMERMLLIDLASYDRALAAGDREAANEAWRAARQHGLPLEEWSSIAGLDPLSVKFFCRDNHLQALFLLDNLAEAISDEYYQEACSISRTLTELARSAREACPEYPRSQEIVTIAARGVAGQNSFCR